MREGKKLVIKILLVVLCFAAIAFTFIKLEENGVFEKPVTEDTGKGALDILREKEVVYFDGKPYLPNHSVYSYLFVGLDKHGVRITSNSYVNTLNADFVALLIVDGYRQEYRIMMINRDTMVQMDTYGLGGKKGVSKYQQLTLAHTYGDGLTLSAENITKAVSNFLYGVEITNYVTVTLDAIEIVTDSVGGVKVVLEEDYTELDPSYKKGSTVLISSENVESFIRARQGMNEPTNTARMVRQRQYIEGLASKLNSDNVTDSLLESIYTDISSYMITNCGLSSFTNIVNILTEYKNCGIVTPEGETKVVNGYMQFIADDQALKTTITELFYKKADFLK